MRTRLLPLHTDARSLSYLDMMAPHGLLRATARLTCPAASYRAARSIQTVPPHPPPRVSHG